MNWVNSDQFKAHGISAALTFRILLLCTSFIYIFFKTEPGCVIGRCNRRKDQVHASLQYQKKNVIVASNEVSSKWSLES